MWLMNNSSRNITIDYGTVNNLDDVNVSYPILITIAADTRVYQKMFVACYLTNGLESENLTFDITPTGLNVSNTLTQIKLPPCCIRKVKPVGMLLSGML